MIKKGKVSVLLIILLILLNMNGLNAKIQSIKGQAKPKFQGAKTEWSKGLFSKAQDLFKEVIEFYPNHVESLYKIGEIYFSDAGESTDKKLATQLYESAHQYYLRTEEAILNIPDYQKYTTDDIKKTNFAEILDDIQKKEESIWVNIWSMGEEHFNDNEYEEAEYYYLKCIEINPKKSYAYLRMSEIGAKTDNQEKKSSYLEMILEADPSNTKVFLNIAIDYFEQENWEKAREYYLKYLEYDQEDYRVFVSLAEVEMKENNYTKALEYTEIAISLEPDIIGNYINAYNISVTMNDKDKYNYYVSILAKLIPDDKIIIAAYCYKQYAAKEWEELLKYLYIWYELEPEAQDINLLTSTIIDSLENGSIKEDYKDFLEMIKPK